jgi:hypothetical protein
MLRMSVSNNTHSSLFQGLALYDARCFRNIQIYSIINEKLNEQCKYYVQIYKYVPINIPPHTLNKTTSWQNEIIQL